MSGKEYDAEKLSELRTQLTATVCNGELPTARNRVTNCPHIWAFKNQLKELSRSLLFQGVQQRFPKSELEMLVL